MKGYLSLGSNLGDRGAYLQAAIKGLEDQGVKIIAISPIYVTEPWGGVEQPEFWNLALQVESVLEPPDLLQACQSVEMDLGRERLIHWGPRTIDIDILLYDNRVSNTLELTLPHPHMEERAFVLAPLRDIAPGLILPSGRSIQDVQGDGKVWPLDSDPGRNK